MSTSRVYKNDRPSLTITYTGGQQLGNCYYSSCFQVTSLKPLSKKNLMALREAGFLGSGQEFMIHGQVMEDGSLHPVVEQLGFKPAVPSGRDTVECAEIDDMTNVVVARPSMNPYTNEPDVPSLVPYYTYNIESRVDSSD